jgi:ribonuclease HII
VYSIGESSAEYIDTHGIVNAIQFAIDSALSELHKKNINKDSFIFLDGGLKVESSFPQETVIKGDEKIQEISLASIFAKEYRDSKMKEFALMYPEYGFESHVGYGTKKHYDALQKYGTTPLHRNSFLNSL